MAGNTNAKVHKFGGSLRNMTDRGLHEEEEGREQDLFRRNEFGYSMGGNKPSGTTAYPLSEDLGKLWSPFQCALQFCGNSFLPVLKV